jgi:hypothetical protein
MEYYSKVNVTDIAVGRNSGTFPINATDKTIVSGSDSSSSSLG